LIKRGGRISTRNKRNGRKCGKTQVPTKKMAVVLQCANGITGAWHSLPIDQAALVDVTSCPVCTEDYFGASCASTPRATCSEGHTCCEACYRKLSPVESHQVRPHSGILKCPTCRRVENCGYLRSISETDGLCGTLVRRGLLRWACGTGCGFGGRLAQVHEHIAACGAVGFVCPSCGHEGPRSSFADHVAEKHADVTVEPLGMPARRFVSIITLDERALRYYIKLPFGMLACASIGGSLGRDVVEVTLPVAGTRFEPLSDKFAVTIVLSGAESDTCSWMRVVDVHMLTHTRVLSFPAPRSLLVRTMVRVEARIVPEGGVVWLNGARVARVPSSTVGVDAAVVFASMRSRTAKSTSVAAHTRVELASPHAGDRCWYACKRAAGGSRTGTVVRRGVSECHVRDAEGVVSVVDAAMCGRLCAAAAKGVYIMS
jgi:hypothetical protein